jgi:hypothetical protein
LRKRFPIFIARAASLAALALILITSACGRGPSGEGSVIRIGSPDGAGAVLANYAVKKMNVSAEVSKAFDYFDCCYSGTQWALSSQSLDAAILCPDEADSLIAKDSRYTIIGPCLANSVLVVVKDRTKTKSIGVAQSRQYQKRLVQNLFGPESKAKPMLIQALPAAYEKNLVDGVVVDVEQAFRLNGTRLSVNRNDIDVITYMLVARKDLPGIDELINAFSSAAEELNNVDSLQGVMTNLDIYPDDNTKASQWLEAGLRFVPITRTPVVVVSKP